MSATLHCLTGCAIGEVLGMVIGAALGWSALQTIALAVALAFVFGYALTIRPVLRSGLAWSAAGPVALAADTLSITVMEIVDNAVMLLIPGAMDAGLASPLFWGSLAFALAVAFVVTVPVNRWLITRGRGHATAAQYHPGQGGHGGEQPGQRAQPGHPVRPGLAPAGAPARAPPRTASPPCPAGVLFAGRPRTAMSRYATTLSAVVVAAPVAAPSSAERKTARMSDPSSCACRPGTDRRPSLRGWYELSPRTTSVSRRAPALILRSLPPAPAQVHARPGGWPA